MKKAILVPGLALVLLVSGCSGQGAAAQKFSCDEISFSISVPDYVGYEICNGEHSHYSFPAFDKRVSIAGTGDSDKPVTMSIEYIENNAGNTLLDVSDEMAVNYPEAYSFEEITTDGKSSYISTAVISDELMTISCDYMLSDTAWLQVAYTAKTEEREQYRGELVKSLKELKFT